MHSKTSQHSQPDFDKIMLKVCDLVQLKTIGIG